jgi:hypothetical protein
LSWIIARLRFVTDVPGGVLVPLSRLKMLKKDLVGHLVPGRLIRCPETSVTNLRRTPTLKSEYFTYCPGFSYVHTARWLVEIVCAVETCYSWLFNDGQSRHVKLVEMCGV